MNKRKTLKELGEEYLSYIKLNEESIEACKRKIKRAADVKDTFTVAELKRTLSVLYEISRELKTNSEHLIKYYGDKNSLSILCNGERKE